MGFDVAEVPHGGFSCCRGNRTVGFDVVEVTAQ